MHEDARVAQWQGLAVASLLTRVRLPAGANLGCSHHGSYPSSLLRSFAPALESGKGRKYYSSKTSLSTSGVRVCGVSGV
jgi:hypothetical protein